MTDCAITKTMLFYQPPSLEVTIGTIISTMHAHKYAHRVTMFTSKMGRTSSIKVRVCPRLYKSKAPD